LGLLYIIVNIYFINNRIFVNSNSHFDDILLPITGETKFGSFYSLINPLYKIRIFISVIFLLCLQNYFILQSLSFLFI